MDRDDGSDDADDEGRSRVYPSRTSWGGAFSLAEKFPFLFASRYGIKAYDYWWGYSAAQIELMAVDQPLIVHPRDKNKPKPHSKKEMERIAEEWAKRKENEESLVGKKINLNDFLNS